MKNRQSLFALFCIALPWVWNTPAVASVERHAKATIEQIIITEALKTDRVRPELALAVAQVESNFNPKALSHKGAIGVMQIMPATGRGVFGVEPDALWDPETNIRLGVKFLDSLLKRYRGREDLALSHYNGGSRVGAWPNSRVIPYTRGYVDKVLTYAGSAPILAKVSRPLPESRTSPRLWTATEEAFAELDSQLAILKQRQRARLR